MNAIREMRFLTYVIWHLGSRFSNHFHLEIHNGVLRKHLSPDCLQFHWDYWVCVLTPPQINKLITFLDIIVLKYLYLICLTLFFYWCLSFFYFGDKMPDQSTLRKKGFIDLYILIIAHHWGKARQELKQSSLCQIDPSPTKKKREQGASKTGEGKTLTLWEVREGLLPFGEK